MSAVADELGRAVGDQKSEFTAETLLPRLQTIMTPLTNEGFFADTVVLVEGESDHAAIIGMAKALSQDFDSAGIAVVPCSGKNNLDRPLVIFRQLDIPVYVVWDGDCGGNNKAKKANRRLLRLLRKAEEDWPNYVAEDSACFEFNLEKTLESEMGKDFFDRTIEDIRNERELNNDQVIKNPLALKIVFEKADSDGRISESLKGIVENIIALNAKSRNG